MGMLTELFGQDVLYWSLERLKEELKFLPPSLKEKRIYLLHEFSTLTGRQLTKEDYQEVP